MPRKKKVDLNELNQTHGALNAPQPVTILGGYGTTYTVASFQEYEAQLKAMTDIDLHDHAYAVGLTPIDNRTLLEDRLVKEFLSKQTAHVFKTIPSTMSKEAQERQRKFLQGSL